MITSAILAIVASRVSGVCLIDQGESRALLGFAISGHILGNIYT